jgi:hypothetical protein
MRSLPGNFDVNPKTGSVASALAESQPVDTPPVLEIFWKNLQDFGPVS